MRVAARPLELLCPAFVLAASVLFSLLLWRAYATVIVLADTSSYMYLARQFIHPSDLLWESGRAPGFGFLLLAALKLPHPAAVAFWAQASLFIANMALAYRAARGICGGPVPGMLAACALLLLEVHVMETFFYSALLLSDGMYANLLFGGTVLFAGGAARGRSGELLGGCAVLGFSGFVRPMHVALLLFLPLLLLLWTRRKSHGIPGVTLALCALLLALPTGIWKARLYTAYGSIPKNPYIGLHLLTHATRLLRPGDVVFADARENAAFHEAAAGRLPAGTEGAWDPFGNEAGTAWGRLTKFYGSRTEVFRRLGTRVTRRDSSEYGLEISRISAAVTLRLIRLHPAEYAGNALRYYLMLFNAPHPAGKRLNTFQADPAKRFGMLPRRNWAEEEAHMLFYGEGRLTPDFSDAHYGYTRMLSRFVMDLPAREFLRRLDVLPGIAFHLLALLPLILLAPSWRRRAGRLLPGTDLRLWAWTVSALLALCFVQYAATAAITLYPHQRFAVPGAMGLHFAAILTLFLPASAALRRVSTRPRAGGSSGAGS